MTNEEKAREIELNIYAFGEKPKGEFEAPAYRAALKMAEWKDQQHAKECESLVGLAVTEARQVFVERACEWISNMPIEYSEFIEKGHCDWIAKDFRKAMESCNSDKNLQGLTLGDVRKIIDLYGHTAKLTKDGEVRKQEDVFKEVLEKFKEGL